MANELERQEAIVDGINGIADVLEVQTEVLGRVETELNELKEWLQTPPSSDLPNLLMALKASVDAMQVEMQRLPERIARAVRDGELGGRG